MAKKVKISEIRSSSSKYRKNIFDGCCKPIHEYHDGFETVLKLEPNEDKTLRDDVIRYKVPFYKREVLAYKLSRLFGFNIVPPTVEVQVDGVNGSRQLWVNGTAGFYRFPESEKVMEQQIKILFFDIVCGNTDRHGDNWVYNKDRKKIWAIDNGLCFPHKKMIWFNSQIAHTIIGSCKDEIREGKYRRIRPIIHAHLGEKTLKKLREIDKDRFLNFFYSFHLVEEGCDCWKRFRKLLISIDRKRKNA